MIRIQEDVLSESRSIPREIALETKNLQVYYGDFHAIKNLSLGFPKYEVTALIGPSGCGKSTYLRTLNRMNDLVQGARYEGEIWFENMNLNDPGIDVVDIRKRIGMVWQRPNPFQKSIFENIALGPRYHGVRSKAMLEEIVEESLRKAALWDEVKDRLHTSALSLSGGQQQRLCIARSIALKPEILLLDEPASALDPISTIKIEELISILKKDYTIIMVTHNMQQAARISSHTAFFLMGELVEFDQTSKLFMNPEQQKTMDYITGRFG
ncbi:phosphate ABC transporter ATP-binding protein PstB [Paenibacillus sp. J2TS4]|uniref:phosphate ABC transporter ATP-binding protein PstB n=1 Tax=Paenibacillus sp. J2TS4 TaxID=2807194 RepID=UPI001B1AAECC|nr:phosphate ABC transporter ATP-binding protein PstB [Paenibacillus sp. J2TS4]GIP33741.1 phosphate import ATP-binding protein PstB 2 [Paenibacillus sp. J2TS4]